MDMIWLIMWIIMDYIYGLIILIMMNGFIWFHVDYNDGLYTGWWLRKNPSEKYDFVNWDDDIPIIWKNNVPNHQPVVHGFATCLQLYGKS